jgi:Mg2+ and Co2+ transporter CorA
MTEEILGFQILVFPYCVFSTPLTHNASIIIGDMSTEVTGNMLSTEKTNRILSVLTILFTLSIPATVIGAIYGMNVHLPGGIDEEGT